MRIVFDKLALIPTYELRKPVVKYPYFLPLQPMGIGTGNVEALSSFLCRQAEDIMEMSHSYMRRILDIYGDSVSETPQKGLHACNGVGSVASRYIRATNTVANGKVDAYYLTLQPLQYLSDCSARGLKRNFLAWCDECWKEDIQAKQAPYVRLYWLFQATKACAIHNRRLSEYCPACNEIQKQYPSHPRQWMCDKCGFYLYKNDNGDLDENFSSSDAWSSHAIYRLVERVYKDRVTLDKNCVSRAIQRILDSNKIPYQDFATRLQICPKMVKKLLSNEIRPYFPALLDLCYRMDIPLDQFLLDSDILTSQDIWRNLDKPFFYAASHLTDKNKEQIRKYLQRILAQNPMPAIRVTHIARKFGINYSALSYNFPNEYKLLRERYVVWEQTEYNRGHTDRLQNLTDAAFSLVRHGTYPSDRKLRDLGLVQASDLRREDVLCILRSIQEVYRRLNKSAFDKNTRTDKRTD